MDEDNWLLNLEAALVDMATWKKQYVEKVKKENPDISKKELAKKIRNAQAQKFKGEYDFLITEHPEREKRYGGSGGLD